MNIRDTDKKTLRISALLTALPVLLGWGFEIIRFLTPLTDRSTFSIRSHLYTLESIVERALFPSSALCCWRCSSAAVFPSSMPIRSFSAAMCYMPWA